MVAALLYSLRKDAVSTASPIPIDGRRCFAALNGSGEFYVRLTDVEFFLEGLYACIP